MVELIAFVRGALDEDEQWAKEASRSIFGDQTPTGEHWRWEGETTDHPVVVDPMLGAYVEGHDHESIGLRSVEEYPTDYGRGLVHLVIDGQQELQPAVAGHIARWDPARVLAEVEAKRRILARHAPLDDSLHEVHCAWCSTPSVGAREPWPCPDLRDLVQPYAGRLGWQEDWAIEP